MIASYLGPNGVEHTVTMDGCQQCDEVHLDKLHKQVRHLFHSPAEPCQLFGAVGGYPYECRAKDRAPEALIVTCATHHVWWAAP